LVPSFFSHLLQAMAMRTAFSRLVASRATSSSSFVGRRFFRTEQTAMLGSGLKESDPEIFDIIEKEKTRQRDSLVLIPSENFTSSAVLQALGSIMQNKVSISKNPKQQQNWLHVKLF
jgi:glycine hydroxymethyltransferase